VRPVSKLGKHNILRNSGQALKQAAQGGGWVPIRGGISKICRCGTFRICFSSQGGV